MRIAKSSSDSVMCSKADKVISDKTVSVCEYLYLAYLSVMMITRGIGLYEGMMIYSVSLVIGIFFIGLKIISTEHTLFEYMWMITLVTFAMIVYRNTGEKGLLVCVFTMIGIKGVSMQKVFRTGAVVWSASFVILTLLAINGLIPENILMHNKHGIGYIVCHALGYPHPNVLHVSYIVVMMFIMYSLGKQSRKKLLISTLLLMLGNIFVFYYSVSFTGFIGATVYLIFNLYFQLRQKPSGIEKVLIQMIFTICVLFSIAGPVLIKGRAFDLINKALNTRYFLSNYFLTQQPITLMGSRLVVPNYRYTMDCSYVYLLVQLGVIPFILMMILYFMLIRDCLKNGRKTELAIIISLCIVGVAEPFMFNLSFKNLIFFFAGSYLFVLSERIQSVLPNVFARKIRFIAVGEKNVPHKMLIIDRICNGISKLVSGGKSRRRYINVIAVIAAMLITMAVYICTVKRPTCVYVDEDTNQDMELEPEYLSSDEMNQRLRDGEIEFNYIDQEHPMFAYDGNAPKIEYSRRLIETMLLSGVSVWTIMLILELIRDRKYGRKGETK